jgi:DNA-binding protein
MCYSVAMNDVVKIDRKTWKTGVKAVKQALEASRNDIASVTIHTNGKTPQRVVDFTEIAKRTIIDRAASKQRWPKPLRLALVLLAASVTLFVLWLIFSIKWWY